MRTPLAFVLALAIPCAGCFGDAPEIDASTAAATETGTASGTTGTTGTSGVDGSSGAAAATSLDGTSSDGDTGTPPMCGDGGIPVPAMRTGWSAPFFAYGLQSNLAMAPDCGGGTRGVPLGTVEPGTTSCACVCDAQPHQVCSVSVETCGGETIGDIGQCRNLDGVPAGVGFFPMSTPPCPSALRVIPKGETPLAFRCEVIVEDGCTSDAPEADGLCVFIDGEVPECPSGYDAGPPIVLEDPRCEGTCDPCETGPYCNGTATMERFDTDDCQGDPFATTTAGQCPQDAPVSVRMAPIPLTCDPTDGGGNPTPISVCCAP